MGKDRFLDACHNAFGITFLILFLSSCSVPHIAILKDPLTPEEHINLGLSYEERGEYRPAEEQYKSAADKLPIAYLYLGNLYFQRGEYAQSEEAYKKAIRETDDPRAYNNLAWLYHSTDRELETAERLAEKAVSLSPGSENFRDTLQKVRGKLSRGPLP